jgi:hypothetical protein
LICRNADRKSKIRAPLATTSATLPQKQKLESENKLLAGKQFSHLSYIKVVRARGGAA